MLDSFGRNVHYLRISVTDRCNLKCSYCRSGNEEFLPGDKILKFEEIIRIVRAAIKIGFDKFRITGGEPLLRTGIPALLDGISNAAPGCDLSLTTNGIHLAKFAKPLKDAGLKRINLSLDSLKETSFKGITGSDCLKDVIKGLDISLTCGFERIKINTVVLRGINHSEIRDFANLAKEKGLYIRFIEFMPYGANRWDSNLVYSHKEILNDLSDMELIPCERSDGGPSRDYVIGKSRGKIGIISPLTRTFCDDCNRIRLTSDGNLRTCLFSEGEIPLRDKMRSKVSDDELIEIIKNAIAVKPKCHNLEEDTTTPASFLRKMVTIGG